MDEWEPEVSTLVRSILRPEKTFFDVGAYEGHYTFLAAPLCAHVFAFEPIRGLADDLVKRCKQMNLRNVIVVNCALFSRSVMGYVSGEGDTLTIPRHVFVSHEEYGLQDCDPCSAIRLDNFFEDRVDLIKIDVEGAELDVLKGAEKTLQTWSPDLILEIHPPNQYFSYTLDDYTEFLSEMGYSWRPIDFFGDIRQAQGAGKMCHIFAERFQEVVDV